MNKLILSLLCFVIGLNLHASDLTYENLYDHSEWWPPHANLLEKKPLTEDHSIHPFMRGVVLRLNPDRETAWIDFGRKGIHRIALEETNILPQAQALANGTETKPYPNLTYMLGNTLVEPTPDGILKLQFLDKLHELDFVLFVYFEDEADIPAISTALRSFEAVLSAQHASVILMPLFEYTNDSLYEALHAHGSYYDYMRDYLSLAYRKAVHHEVHAPVYFVLADANGKILSEFPLEAMPAPDELNGQLAAE